MKIQWSNPASVTSALTALLGAVVAVLATVQPGFHLPTSVEASLSSVGVIVAAAAGIAHTWHLTRTHVAKVAAEASIVAAATPVEPAAKTIASLIPPAPATAAPTATVTTTSATV